MSFRVVLGRSVDAMPADVRVDLRERLSEIGESLDGIDAGASAIWDSLSLGGLQIDVKGWRVIYRADREHGTLSVSEALFKGFD